eukprot:4283973-Pyramimonas_sp.AAC.2
MHTAAKSRPGLTALTHISMMWRRLVTVTLLLACVLLVNNIRAERVVTRAEVNQARDRRDQQMQQAAYSRSSSTPLGPNGAPLPPSARGAYSRAPPTRALASTHAVARGGGPTHAAVTAPRERVLFSVETAMGQKRAAAEERK